MTSVNADLVSSNLLSSIDKYLSKLYRDQQHCTDQELYGRQFEAATKIEELCKEVIQPCYQMQFLAYANEYFTAWRHCLNALEDEYVQELTNWLERSDHLDPNDPEPPMPKKKRMPSNSKPIGHLRINSVNQIQPGSEREIRKADRIKRESASMFLIKADEWMRPHLRAVHHIQTKPQPQSWQHCTIEDWNEAKSKAGSML